MAQILDGRTCASKLEESMKAFLQLPHTRKPCLAFIKVGEDSASTIYIGMKRKKCQEIGIESLSIELASTISEQKIIEEITKLNNRSDVDGILVQLPLPSHICKEAILEAVDPKKDVDGFHPLNLGKLLAGRKDGFIPCTPKGIIALLQHYNIQTKGKDIVVLGRSVIVGRPLAAMLGLPGTDATVTLAHSQSKRSKELCQRADIVISATGQPLLIKKDWLKEGAVVIDVGIHRCLKSHTIVGDADYSSVLPKVSAITPVPGGVGPMTIAMLMSNTIQSFKSRLPKQPYP